MLQGITKSVRSHSLRPVHQPNALSGKARVEFGTGGAGIARAAGTPPPDPISSQRAELPS